MSKLRSVSTMQQRYYTIDEVKQQKCPTYQHNDNTCACSQCLCGRCKCNQQSNSIEYPRTATTSYQRAYPWKKPTPAIAMEHHEYVQLPDPMQSVSTYKSYFRPFSVQKQRDYRYPLSKSPNIPFEGRSRYHTDYVPKSTADTISFKPIEHSRSINIPIADTTTYKSTFKYNTPSIQPNIQHKPHFTLHDQSPNIYMQSSYQHFYKRLKQSTTQPVKPIQNQLFMPGGDASLYRTNYRTEFKSKRIGKCRAREILEDIVSIK